MLTGCLGLQGDDVTATLADSANYVWACTGSQWLFPSSACFQKTRPAKLAPCHDWFLKLIDPQFGNLDCSHQEPADTRSKHRTSIKSVVNFLHSIPHSIEPHMILSYLPHPSVISSLPTLLAHSPNETHGCLPL